MNISAVGALKAHIFNSTHNLLLPGRAAQAHNREVAAYCDNNATYALMLGADTRISDTRYRRLAELPTRVSCPPAGVQAHLLR